MASSGPDVGVPLYQQIKRWIRDAVARGDFDPAAPFTSERELRERFNVSNATAVRALNDLVGEGVLVRRQGRGTFVADSPAPQASPRNRSIAYVVSSNAGPHGTGIMQGISAVCTELGFRFYVTETVPSPETAPSHDVEARAIRDSIETGASGILWYPLEGPGDQALLAELDRHEIPLVFIDRYLPISTADAVLADNFAIGSRLTKKLIKDGHRRIATLWDEAQCTSITDRSSGHVQALREGGLPVSADLTALRSYSRQPESARQADLTALLGRSEPPTVMLCSNGYLLATAARDLVNLGLRVPEDIELASMDDAGPFDLLPIASVAAHLPSRDMGETAMRILARRIDGDQATAEHIVLPITVRSGGEARVRLHPVAVPSTELTG